MTLTSFFLWGAVAYALLPNWNALTEGINTDMKLIPCENALEGKPLLIVVSAPTHA